MYVYTWLQCDTYFYIFYNGNTLCMFSKSKHAPQNPFCNLEYFSLIWIFSFNIPILTLYYRYQSMIYLRKASSIWKAGKEEMTNQNSEYILKSFLKVPIWDVLLYGTLLFHLYILLIDRIRSLISFLHVENLLCASCGGCKYSKTSSSEGEILAKETTNKVINSKLITH